jgi:putative PEP-CTERM system histidine kinase
VLAVALAAGALVYGATLVPSTSGPFEVALLTPIGLASAVYQIIVVVGVLAGLEACLRLSQGRTRRRTKFLVLGLGGIFLVNFYLLSQSVLFRLITLTDLRIGTTMLLIGNVVVALGLARFRSGDMELTISRGLVYRSVIVGVLGAYLLAVGGIGWLLNYLQIPEHTFWLTVGAFASAIVLAATLLSEEARWRLNRFLALHVYRSKYDYREQWIAFTRRLGTLLTLDELSPQLVEAVAQAVDGNAAMFYLLDSSGQNYYLAGTFDVVGAPDRVAASDRVVGALATTREPLMLDAPVDWGDGAVAEVFGERSVAVPLAWHSALIGFLIVSPERTGVPYTLEDLQFMATMGQQATGTIVTARLSEDLARAREFDAFARLASFVVHDLKNMISGLSLLSQNAAKYMDDPEFQKDALVTLSRTVERMHRLMARLSSRAEPVLLESHSLNLAKVVTETLRTVTRPENVQLLTSIDSVRPVRGDADALMRVVHNLVTNAIQAIEGDGVLTVTLKQEGNAASLVVADTGSGMSEDFVRGSLFVPFKSTKPGGWGIGLYQVKEVVERHNGKVLVRSTIAVGTTFEVILPTEEI